MSTWIWLGVWAVLTAGALVGVVLAVDKEERNIAARFFIGWTLGTWAVLGMLYLLGWWTP